MDLPIGCESVFINENQSTMVRSEDAYTLKDSDSGTYSKRKNLLNICLSTS
jgi:hypothetical protein